MLAMDARSLWAKAPGALGPGLITLPHPRRGRVLSGPSSWPNGAGSRRGGPLLPRPVHSMPVSPPLLDVWRRSIGRSWAASALLAVTGTVHGGTHPNFV